VAFELAIPLITSFIVPSPPAAIIKSYLSFAAFANSVAFFGYFVNSISNSIFALSHFFFTSSITSSSVILGLDNPANLLPNYIKVHLSIGAFPFSSSRKNDLLLEWLSSVNKIHSWLTKYIAVIYNGGQDVKLLQDGKHSTSLEYKKNIITNFGWNSLLFSCCYFFSAFEYAIATACFWASFIDFGWLVPIVPSSL